MDEVLSLFYMVADLDLELKGHKLNKFEISSRSSHALSLFMRILVKNARDFPGLTISYQSTKFGKVHEIRILFFLNHLLE